MCKLYIKYIIWTSLNSLLQAWLSPHSCCNLACYQFPSLFILVSSTIYLQTWHFRAVLHTNYICKQKEHTPHYYRCKYGIWWEKLISLCGWIVATLTDPYMYRFHIIFQLTDWHKSQWLVKHYFVMVFSILW